MSATRVRTAGGNFTRSLGHHAPDAPNPSIVCAGAAATRTTVRFAGVARVVLVVPAGTGGAVCSDEEHEATSAQTAIVARARRIREEPTDVDRQEAVRKLCDTRHAIAI